jgi:hypothetical protein
LIAIVLAGQMLWTNFLISEGNPIVEERQFSTWLSSSVENKQTEIAESSFIKTTAKNYLISINLFPYLGKGDQTNTKEYSFVSGYQNVAIAQRIYNTGYPPLYCRFFVQGVLFQTKCMIIHFGESDVSITHHTQQFSSFG